MIDGGVVCNCPLQQCIDKYKNTEEMLAVKIHSVKMNDTILESSNMLTFGYYLIDCLINKSNKIVEIPNIVHIPC